MGQYSGKLYCAAESTTAKALYMTNSQGFFLSDWEPYLVYNDGQTVGVLSYYGSSEAVIIPTEINRWINTENHFESVILPEGLNRGSHFMFSVHNVTVSEGTTETGLLELYDVEKIFIPDTIHDFEMIKFIDCNPTIYCNVNSDAIGWAYANDYDVVEMEESNWNEYCTLTYTGASIEIETN